VGRLIIWSIHSGSPKIKVLLEVLTHPSALSEYIHLTHQLVIVNCILNSAGDFLMKCCFANSSECCLEFAFALKITLILLLVKMETILEKVYPTEYFLDTCLDVNTDF
jgi:hypothetical protein